MPVAPELKHLRFGSVIRVVAKIRLARMAFAKLQQAIFGTRRVALESKKMLTYRANSRFYCVARKLGCKCGKLWSLRLLQRHFSERRRS